MSPEPVIFLGSEKIIGLQGEQRGATKESILVYSYLVGSSEGTGMVTIVAE
jgi:hypothetical protein